MKFHITSPIPSKSLRLFALLPSTCLPWIYLAKKLSETLIFLASDGTMKWNGVEGSTPQFGLSRSLWIVRKLYIDDVVLMEAVRWGSLIASVWRPRVVQYVGHLANLQCLLLLCLVRQFRTSVFHVFRYRSIV